MGEINLMLDFRNRKKRHLCFFPLSSIRVQASFNIPLLKISLMIPLLIIVIFSSCASLKSVKSNKRDIIIRSAKNMLNKMYRYGVQDKHLGFDCSGLTQFAYREAGINIPRTSSSQHRRATKISKEELEPADLVFFSTLGPGATHVGIYLGEGKFIHAPSPGKKVQIVSMDNPYWKKNYYAAGTYLK